MLLYNNTYYAYSARKAQMAFKIPPINIKSVWEVLQKLVLWAVAQYIPPFSDVLPIRRSKVPCAHAL